MNTSKIEKAESKVDQWMDRNPRKTVAALGAMIGITLVAAAYAGASFAIQHNK